MSEKLHQAIAATRAGQKRDAQLLLTEVLTENPDNEHAWFLLGNLVDSPEKRMAYLGKALTINPHYEKAKQQFSQMQRQVMAVPSMAKSEKFEAEPAVVEEISTLPDWLTDEFEDDSAPELTTDDDVLAVVGTLVDAGKEEVVESREMVKTAVAPIEEVVESREMVKTAVAPIAVLTAPTDRDRQLRRYNYLLGILVILIILVLIMLIRSL